MAFLRPFVLVAIVVVTISLNSTTARSPASTTWNQLTNNNVDDDTLMMPDENIQVQFGGINNFKSAFPLSELEPLRMESHVRGRINYTLGSRVRGISKEKKSP